MMEIEPDFSGHKTTMLLDGGLLLNSSVFRKLQSVIRYIRLGVAITTALESKN